MSRIEAVSLDDDHEALAKSQESDLELANLHRADSGLRLTKVIIPGTNTSITCDVSTGKPRPYLTPPFRRAVFDKLHNLSHPGVKATTRLMLERYVWPSIKKDCRLWTQACQACQRSKVTRHASAPIGQFENPSGRFMHVHIDIVGPLPVCNDYRYCLTAIDRVSRWPEVWPMRTITAEETADTFTRGWISRFGVPSIITTDQGTQFESDLFRRLTEMFATKRVRTTAYHPCANGMIERVHRTLKAALMCRGGSWYSSLPFVLLGMRTAFKDDLKATAAEMLYGETLRLPGEFLSPWSRIDQLDDPADYVVQLRQKMVKTRPIPASRHCQTSSFIFKNLETATHAFLRDDTVRRPLQPPYTGPHLILERSRDGKNLTLDVRGRRLVVSVDRVKPAFVASDKEDTPISPAPPQVSPHQAILDPLLPTAPQTASDQPAPRVTTRSGRVVRFKDNDDFIYLSPWGGGVANRH